MKSRISCCNGALLRRLRSRTLLLWGGYLLMWLVAMPVNLLSMPEWTKAVELQEQVVTNAASTCHMVPFFYGLLVAWYLFLYLHRSRSANFFGALPLRRETLFLTHYLAGLLCGLVPNFLVMGVTMLAGASCGVSLVLESAIWFAASSLGCIFYYSLAVLCAQLVGNLIAMPPLYLVLNFVVVVVEAMVKDLLESILYGIRFTGSPKLGFLSPLYDAALDGNGPECTHIWVDNELAGVEFEGWTGLLILAAVGVALAVGAFFLHKHRRMEVAGDVVAVKPLKPVFLYCFTFGFALVGGTILAEMVVTSMDSQYALSICACVVLCVAVGYFLGEMILLRTLRVFRKRNFARCAVCVCVAAAALLCTRMDILGVESYVPDFDEVAAVRLDYSNNDVTDPVRIQQMIDLHQEILDRKAETEALCRQDVWTPRVELSYTLKDGSKLERSYRLPVADDLSADPNSLIYKFDELNNTPEMIMAREFPSQPVTMENIRNCVINYYDGEQNYNHTLDPSNAEAYALWWEAMRLDFEDGSMGTTYYADRFVTPRSAEVTETVAVPQTATYSGVSVELELYRADDSERTEYYYYEIPAEATRTRAALVALGVPDGAFELTDEE